MESYLKQSWESCFNFNTALKTLPIGDKAVLLRTSWDVQDALPLPESVETNLVARNHLARWHYNVQSYTD